MTTGDGQDLLKRTELEEVADRLCKAGIRNQRLMVDILKALSGPSSGEVRFNIELGAQTQFTKRRNSAFASQRG